MDATNRLNAITAPEEFRARSSPLHGPKLKLAPHGIATLDFANL